MHKPIIVTLVCLCVNVGAPAREWTLRVDLNGRHVEGTPVEWSEEIVRLLGRDGYLWEFPPHEASNFRKQSDAFRIYSQSDMRGQLLREFGQGFDVSGTGHYLVVHPTGQRDHWASRFEELYRSMAHYFAVRGFSMKSPRFPMVAVVFPRHGDFLRHAANEGVSINSSVLGYYSHTSNRILLYDVTAGRPNEAQWFVNAETIIHEAAHQTAFNTGIHSRYALPPRWLAEGIGTMFESRGVWDSREYTELNHRVNWALREAYVRFFPQGLKAETIAQLITQDRYFQQNPDAAYALSWAITFYLAEREPRSLADYLKSTASRPGFELYSGPQRQQDFVRIFGNNLTMLGARVDRFLKDLN